jgi:hypothetical protein
MRFKSNSLVIFAASAVLPFVVNPDLNAQSIPVGQVSTRFASKQTPGPGSRYSTSQGGSEQMTLSLASTAPEDWSKQITSDQSSLDHAAGTAARTAWSFLLKEEKSIKPDAAVGPLHSVVSQIADNLTPSQAVQLAIEACTDASLNVGCKKWQKAAETGILVSQTVKPGETTLLDQLIDALQHFRCTVSVTNAQGGSGTTASYSYPVLFPTFGSSCSTDAIKNFFSVSKSLSPADKVQYLYNAQQSTSQVDAQLLTATFAGFQMVFSGTSTSGTSQPSNSNSTANSNSNSSSGSSRHAVSRMDSTRMDSSGDSSGGSTTDSVDTAVSKIEAGGDFNVSFPVPVFNYSKGDFGVYGFTSPNVGFLINGFSGQNAITEASEYTLNTPFEAFAQLFSIDKDSSGNPNATIFLDLKPAMEVVSQAMASKIGLTGSREFFLGQGDLGIEFAGGIRLSFQYLTGPKQIYQSVNSSGTATTTSNTIGGFHLAVSFSPQKSKT